MIPGSGGEGSGSSVAVGTVGSGEGCARSRVNWVVGAGIVGLVAVLVGATSGSLQVIAASGCGVALRALNGSVQAG